MTINLTDQEAAVLRTILEQQVQVRGVALARLVVSIHDKLCGEEGEAGVVPFGKELGGE